MRSVRAPMLVSALLASVVSPAAAQTVVLRVVSAESSQPVFGALVYLEDGEGAMIKNALTDERGRLLFVGLGAGSYRLRVEMIGKGTV